MLTTMTTVLGMAPLLYEQSQQAQFLKPTVITLVYGLGFGMLLVLLVVPALVAAQHDVARQIAAMRRGTAAPVRSLRWGLLVLWSLIAAWGAVTLGWAAWQGAVHPQVLALLPMLGGLKAMSGALAAFVAGALVVALAGYAGGIAVYTIGGRKRRAA